MENLSQIMSCLKMLYRHAFQQCYQLARKPLEVIQNALPNVLDFNNEINLFWCLVRCLDLHFHRLHHHSHYLHCCSYNLQISRFFIIPLVVKAIAINVIHTFPCSPIVVPIVVIIYFLQASSLVILIILITFVSVLNIYDHHSQCPWCHITPSFVFVVIFCFLRFHAPTKA